MKEADLHDQVAGILESAKPAGMPAHLIVQGDLFVNVHLYKPEPQTKPRKRKGSDIVRLLAMLGDLDREQLLKVGDFVAAVRGGG